MAAVCPPVAYADQSANTSYMNLLCAVDPESQPGGSLPDIQSVGYAKELLTNLTATQQTAPWLVAVGLHKPHIPLKFDRKYLDLYPISQILHPEPATKPEAMPSVAWDTFDDVRKRQDIAAVIAAKNVTYPYGPLPTMLSLLIKQHYFGAVSYVDGLMGTLFDTVDNSRAAENTIVLVFGDHGWQL